MQNKKTLEYSKIFQIAGDGLWRFGEEVEESLQEDG